MSIGKTLDEVRRLQVEFQQLNLSIGDLLKLVTRFRLDWGVDEAQDSNDFKIGMTKPILLKGLSNFESKIRSDPRLLDNSEVSQILVKSFLDHQYQLSKELILRIHSLVVPNGGEFRKQEVRICSEKETQRTLLTKAENIASDLDTLIAWLNQHAKDKEINPVVLVSIFHHGFVKVHPFLDGNGRVARILTSLILLGENLPPPILNPNDRVSYLQALKNADSGNIEPITQFIGEKVIESLNIILQPRKSLK